jgi:hypothetical protein
MCIFLTCVNCLFISGARGWTAFGVSDIRCKIRWRAVDEYSEMLKMSLSKTGNRFCLGIRLLGGKIGPLPNDVVRGKHVLCGISTIPRPLTTVVGIVHPQLRITLHLPWIYHTLLSRALGTRVPIMIPESRPAAMTKIATHNPIVQKKKDTVFQFIATGSLGKPVPLDRKRIRSHVVRGKGRPKKVAAQRKPRVGAWIKADDGYGILHHMVRPIAVKDMALTGTMPLRG